MSNAADTRAQLFSMYSSGQKPRFLRLHPNGTDEIYALGEQAVIVPAIPPNAPDVLENALRIRRSAILNGQCPHCKVPATPEVLPDIAGTPALAVTFNHRHRCPAEDKKVLRMISDFERQRQRDDVEELDFNWAQQRNREKMSAIKPYGIMMDSPKARARAEGLLDQLSVSLPGITRCDHLAIHPAQPWNIFLAAKRWLCDECWERRAEEISIGEKHHFLGPVEEHTCDLCRRFKPEKLQPLMFRIDLFVMHGAACENCVESLTEQKEVAR